jgi:hypothetical protein
VSTTRSTTTVPRTVGPADALALPERVAAVQLAEPRGQDVVGEVADVGVAEDAPVRQRRDRREERAPAGAAGADVDVVVTSITAIQAGEAVREDLRARRDVDRADRGSRSRRR